MLFKDLIKRASVYDLIIYFGSRSPLEDPFDIFLRRQGRSPPVHRLSENKYIPKSGFGNLPASHLFINERNIIFFRRLTELLPEINIRDSMQVNMVLFSSQELKNNSFQIKFIRIRN